MRVDLLGNGEKSNFPMKKNANIGKKKLGWEGETDD